MVGKWGLWIVWFVYQSHTHDGGSRKNLTLGGAVSPGSNAGALRIQKTRQYNQYRSCILKGMISRLTVPRGRKQKLHAQLKATPRTGTTSLLLYSVGGGRHWTAQIQDGNKLLFLIGVWQGYSTEGHVGGLILRWHLWKVQSVSCIS